MTLSLPLLLLVATLAGSPSAPDDARALLLKVVENQERNEDLQRQYAYVETLSTQYLDGQGEATRTESEASQVTPTLGGEYKRRLARDGQALAPREAAEEEKKLREHLDKQQRLSLQEQEKARGRVKRRTDRFKTRLREALEVYDFTPLPDERLDQRAVAVFRFQPRPGYQPRSRATSVLSKLEGTIWIDPQQAQIARLQVIFREDFKVAGGVFGKIARGSEANASQHRLNDEVWLLDQITVRVQGRLYFLKRYNQIVTASYSDYRKFTVRTEEGDFRPLPPKEDR